VSESLTSQYRDALIIAERALGAALTAIEKLDSDRKLVLRCSATASGMPRSVIVGQLLPNDDDQQADQQARFANEWAGLEFLTEIDCHCAPRVYASDPQHRLLVLEDLGDHPPLMDTLQTGEADEVAIGLQRFLSLLGQLHAATYGRENLFLDKRRALQAPELPNDDAKTDLRNSIGDFARNFARLKIPMSDAIASEIGEFSSAVHDDPDLPRLHP